VPVRYPWYRPQLLIHAARPVTEPEGVRIVQEIRAGAHVTGPIELPLNGPSAEEERSSRQPGGYGCLEAVVGIGACALAAVGLRHLRRKSEMRGLQVEDCNWRAMGRVDDLRWWPLNARQGSVHGL